MFGTKCQWEMIFDLTRDEGGEAATGEMVKHLQALPIGSEDLPSGIVKALRNTSDEYLLDDKTVGRIQWAYYQTGGGAVSAAVEYFEEGEVIPFHIRGYQLSCSPGSDWVWWLIVAGVGIGAFALGRVQ